jgi:hypothetical protein
LDEGRYGRIRKPRRPVHHAGWVASSQIKSESGSVMMDRFPTRDALTPAEFSSLCLVSKGFMGKTIPSDHRKRLVELGLIQDIMGGLMPTPAGRIVSRS